MLDIIVILLCFLVVLVGHQAIYLWEWVLFEVELLALLFEQLLQEVEDLGVQGLELVQLQTLPDGFQTVGFEGVVFFALFGLFGPIQSVAKSF
jgi:Na+-driven multidrug efflux pump